MSMKLVPSSLASFAPRFGAGAADVRVRLILLGLSGTDTCYSSTSETDTRHTAGSYMPP